MSDNAPTFICNIVFACPEPPEELGTFYAHLLGWQVLRRDWFVIAPDAETFPRLAFGDGPGEYRRPRWPDPEHPQQMHVDIAVPEVDAFGDLALSLGATLLQDKGSYRTYADPAGHPFCVHGQSSSSIAVAPQISHIVVDCFSPRALAGFYEQLLGMRRESDTAEWVVIGRGGESELKLAFQHAIFPAARWPDPAFPQQLHIDLHAEDGDAAQGLALRLGAIPLRPMGGGCPAFADPAAHPFCLCSPGR